MKTSFQLLTGRNNPYLKEFQGYLVHDEIIPSLKLLQEAAFDEIGAKIKIISSFRDFSKQQIIWNDKASGKRDIYDDQDNKVNIANISKQEIIKKIMRFSALPGASRHHLGTDLDIFDENKLAKENVKLTPSECGPNDIFCDLHSWLDKKIADKKTFGFYRPYDKDLGGVSIEKWHISYAPIANDFFRQYKIDVFIKNIEESEIAFKDIILEDAQFYFDQYIANITHI